MYKEICLLGKQAVSPNIIFKADKPVKPVCGLKYCYVDARTGAQGEESI